MAKDSHNAVMDNLAISLFITSTDTGIGKTFFASVLIKEILEKKLFKAEEIAYFKPIQCGREFRNEEFATDYDCISRENPEIAVFNSYFLGYPAAPNLAAKLENITIDIKKIKEDFKNLKKQFKFIIVEGAGGLAVPITDDYWISDLAKDLNLPIVLVIRTALGTINHSLLSIEHARNKKLEIAGIQVSDVIPGENLQKEDSITSILRIGNVELFSIEKFLAGK